MTGPYVGKRFDVLNGQWMFVDALVLNGAFQHTLERVVAEHADDERRIVCRQGLRRPINKLTEIIQIGGLHLIFGRQSLLRERTGKTGRRGEYKIQRCHCHLSKRHGFYCGTVCRESCLC